MIVDLKREIHEAGTGIVIEKGKITIMSSKAVLEPCYILPPLEGCSLVMRKTTRVILDCQD